MKNRLSPLVLFALLWMVPPAFAAEGGHCEKKAKDGTVSTVEAKDKKACKKKGGTWVDAPKAEEAAEEPPVEETHQ